MLWVRTEKERKRKKVKKREGKKGYKRKLPRRKWTTTKEKGQKEMVQCFGNVRLCPSVFTRSLSKSLSVSEGTRRSFWVKLSLDYTQRKWVFSRLLSSSLSFFSPTPYFFFNHHLLFSLFHFDKKRKKRKGKKSDWVQNVFWVHGKSFHLESILFLIPSWKI